MAKPQTRGRSRRFGILAISLLVLLLIGAVGVVLAASGVHVPLISSVFAKEGQKDEAHAGQVAVLVSPTKLLAFTALDPAAFIDPKTSDFYVAYISAKAAESAGFIRDPNQIRGRVLNHDKEPGLAFSEADFYPRGTRASQTAAVGAGHRGISLSAEKIDGLRGLKRFDCIDIVAVISNSTTAGTAPNTFVAPDVKDKTDKKKAWESTRRILAQNARILVPVPDKNPRGGSTSDEAFVSVTEEEFAAITDALGQGAKIQCGARSGLPGGDATPMVEPEEEVVSTPIRVTEGTTSSTTIVPVIKEVSPAVSESNGSVPTPK